jgi:membrane protein implicated in regulation of membrane protease activity
MLYIVAIAWLYVAGMAAIVEAVSPQGSLLGAALTFVGWGVLPLSIVLYIMATPARRRARRAAQDSAAQPDSGSHATGDAVATERKEP